MVWYSNDYCKANKNIISLYYNFEMTRMWHDFAQNTTANLDA